MPEPTSISVTVLGSCGAWPEPGRACAGFLVSCGISRIVLDLGYGTFPRLSEVLAGDLSLISAVIVSHRHPDHLVDVHALSRALRFTGLDRVPLYAPPAVVPVSDAMDPEEPSPAATSFSLVGLPQTAVTIDEWTLSSVSTPHYVENVAIRLDGPGGSIVYTGDSGPCRALTALTDGCDLLICEATDRYQRGPITASDGMLMTGFDAGVLAAESGARHLVLTHFWPGNDRKRTAEDATKSYGGRITCTDEHESDITHPL